MKDLLPLGEKIGARLKARKETIVVAESATGGLVSAALLAVPGASAYFIGGGTFYTRPSFLALRETNEQMFAGKRGCTEDWALMLARTCATGVRRPGRSAKAVRPGRPGTATATRRA